MCSQSIEVQGATAVRSVVVFSKETNGDTFYWHHHYRTDQDGVCPSGGIDSIHHHDTSSTSNTSRGVSDGHQETPCAIYRRIAGLAHGKVSLGSDHGAAQHQCWQLH